MCPAHASVRNPPPAQLPQDSRFTADRHLTRPFPIDPKPESSPLDKGQIDQFDFELFARLKVANDYAVMRFGSGHDPFYKPKANKARKKSKSPVHAKMHPPVYSISSTSR
jgi:hypothetical protein